ncbi:MAG: hypothetical protein ACFFD1_02960 [Candidatus Thorarchaeota archaeon]
MDLWQKELKSKLFPWIISYMCSGNIMRSPYAEKWSERLISERYPYLEGKIIFNSGGLRHQNSYIHPDVKKLLLKENFDEKTIDSHQPKLFDNYIDFFAKTHIFIVMTAEHKNILKNKGKNNVYLLNEVGKGIQDDIKDPFYYPNSFNSIFRSIFENIELFVGKLNNFVAEIKEYNI